MPNDENLPNPRSRTRSAQQARAREIRRGLLNEAKFGGAFDVLEEDISPAEAALEQMRRSLAIVRWIEKQMETWAPTLVELGYENIDNKGAMQLIPTHEAAWLDVWRAERQRLSADIKLCSDIGVSERLVAVQEEQADIMFRVLEMAFEALQLTEEQQESLPRIMPKIIRGIALPGGIGMDLIREELAEELDAD